MAKMCEGCTVIAQERGYYISTTSDELNVAVEECGVHPTLSNPRVWRMMNTLRSFMSEPPGFRPTRIPTTMTFEGGWVHLRNLKLILFDYERPFFQVGVNHGLIEKNDETPVTIRLTDRGNDAVGAFVREGRSKVKEGTFEEWTQSWQ